MDLRRYKDDNNSILISLTASGPIYSTDLIVIHDVGFLYRSYYNTGYRIWYKFMVKKLLENAKSIITISNFSKKKF